MGGTNQIRLSRPTKSDYEPTWEGPCEGWAKNFVTRNHWRVAEILDFEEALQECGVVFAHCCNTYRGRVNTPAWFMSLFKTAVGNKFINLAERNRRALLVREAVHQMDPPPALFSEGPAVTALGEASTELRAVLITALVTAPQELAALMLTRREDETWSRALCRWARLPVRSDLIRELKTLLGGPT